MAFRSDIDLSKLHRNRIMDEEISYGLSWRYNRMLNSHKSVNTNLDNNVKNRSNHNDKNNNPRVKGSSSLSNDNFDILPPHREKSGTWP